MSPAPSHIRGPRRKGARAYWAVADQVLISATNFVTMVFLARALSLELFGVFTLLYSVLLFCNSLQLGLVTQPHNVLGASREGDAYRRYTTATLLSQLLLASAASGMVVGAWSVGKLFDWGHTPVLLPLALAIITWQGHECVRRVLYTEGRLLAAFSNDVVGYGGQAAWIAVLWWRHQLTMTSALLVIALTSAAATVLGLWMIRGSLSRRIDHSAFRENWDFGKWLAGGEIVGYWMSTQLFIYLTGALLGAAAVGVLRAIHTLFGPTRVLAYVFTTVLPTRLARTLASDGEGAMHQQLLRAFRVAVPVLGGYCLLAALLAEPLMHLLYGNKYAGHASVLTIYAVYTLVSYLGMIVAAALRARRLTREVFFSRLTASLLSIPVGWVLIVLGRWAGLGLHAAAAAMIVTSAILAAMFWTSYRRGSSKASLAREKELAVAPVAA